MQLTASQPQYAFSPVMMAEGGLAAAARQVQNKGRGDDTVLVHMTPGEVKGLQALAMAQGGSLTINPNTGLPEAGFLKNLLPMIAGIALAPLTAGTSLAFLGTPMGAALTVGGITGLATGSLKKGLMAGLGAYGGAGLGAGLIGAAPGIEGIGAAAIPEGATAVPNTFAETAANLNPQMTPAPTSSSLLETVGSAAPKATMVPADIAANIPTTVQPTGFEAAKSGFSNLFDTGKAGTDARAAFMSNLPTGTLPAVGSTLMSALTPEPPKYKAKDTYLRPYEYAWNYNPEATATSYTPGDTAERRFFNPMYTALPIQKVANGGVIGLANGGDAYDDEAGNDDPYAYAGGGQAKKIDRSLKGTPYYKFAQDRKDSSMEAAIEQNFAAGGLGAASKALPPRFLSGGGDGMSDSIKANIDGVQEARLADGEFVVPADVVSHLGNGSSKAGAKKLYAMMDKIRKARTGSKRQAPEVNAAKYMPA